MVAKHGFASICLRAVMAALLVAHGAIAMAQQEPAPDIKALIAQGVRAHDQRDFDGAIRIYRKVLETEPDNVLALHELSFSLMARRDCPAAIEAATRGVAVAPTPRAKASFHVLIGNCRDMMRDPKGSIQAYRSALELNPSDYLTLFNLGVTLAGTGDMVQAQLSFEEAVALEPGHASSHYALSRVLHAQGRLGVSMLAMLRFLSLEPTGPRATADLPRMDMLFTAGVTRDPATGNTTIKVNPQTLNASPLQAALELGLAVSESSSVSRTPALEPAQAQLERLRSFIAITGEMADKDDSVDFVSKNYMPFFRALHAKGMVEVFANYVMQSKPAQRAWVGAHPVEVQALVQWLREQRQPLVMPPQS